MAPYVRKCRGLYSFPMQTVPVSAINISPMASDDVFYAATILLSVAVGLIFRKVTGEEKRRLLSTFIGAVLLYSLCGYDCCHLVITVIGNCIILVLPELKRCVVLNVTLITILIVINKWSASVSVYQSSFLCLLFCLWIWRVGCHFQLWIAIF